jgi:heptosyltransferase-1
MAAPDPTRVLIIKPSSLGDIVHALPVLAAIRRRWPAAHVAWLIGSSFAPLLAGHPMLDEVIPFDRRHYGRMWRSPRAFLDFWRLVAELRGRRFDLVLDLQGLVRSGLMAWLFYSQRVRCPAGAAHAVDRNLCLAAAAGLEERSPEFPLALRDEERRSARELLRQSGVGESGFVAVLPGARWESKRWTSTGFAAVIDALHADGLRCVLLGAPDERPAAEAVARACRSAPIDLTGRTSLRDLTALLADARLVLCCDSGPMHLAAALGVPTVAVFGPTDPLRTGPYSPAADVVAHAVPCAPCLRRVCPLGHHACMAELDPGRVIDAARRLARGGPSARLDSGRPDADTPGSRGVIGEHS